MAKGECLTAWLTFAASTINSDKTWDMQNNKVIKSYKYLPAILLQSNPL